MDNNSMKYRVYFQCYWYNTGAADNHYYDDYEEFDTLEQARAFEHRVINQHQIFSLSTNDEFWYEKQEQWKASSDFIEIENGFITGNNIRIVKHHPATETLIS